MRVRVTIQSSGKGRVGKKVWVSYKPTSITITPTTHIREVWVS